MSREKWNLGVMIMCAIPVAASFCDQLCRHSSAEEIGLFVPIIVAAVAASHPAANGAMACLTVMVIYSKT